jgi:phospho-N-acetylmuramoyl-pentapeptide-transferase
MGGLIIILGIFLGTFLWADLSNIYVLTVIFVSIGLGLLGFIDDLLKIKQKNSRGLNSKIKLLGQIIISLIAVYILHEHSEHQFLNNLYFPFFKNLILPMGIFFIPFALFVIVGASNAVNLTDGLDGLAIVPIIIAAGVFGLIAYLVGNTIFSNYLNLFYVEGSGELIILCSSLVGAGIGFLWFNAPPASVFMGDTGSLSTGAALGIISVITKHEIVLAIVGGVFVLEAISVIVQVLSFKITGKRIFKMAPIHHHFEKKGWSESTVVIRFWIIAVILGLIGLATLKLR